MDYKKIFTTKSSYLILVPAILALCIALVPTIKYQWPLTWDIYYHVHLSKLYLEHGFTFWDPLTYAPFGRPIFYPPFFHYILAAFSFLFKTDPFQIARSMQPIFAFGMALSFSYVGYKLFNLRVGLLAAFFMFFSMVFHRSMLPLPETMALILFPLTVYFYNCAFQKKGLKYAIMAGLLGGLILLTHSLTGLIMIGVILIFTLLIKMGGEKGEKSEYKSLWVFLGVLILIVAVWWSPLIYQYGYVFNNPLANSPDFWGYINSFIKILGIPAILFSLIWVICILIRGSIKEISKNEILILSWIIFLLILSNAYLLGISVLVERILNFAVFPMAVLASLGVECIMKGFDKRIYYIFILVIMVTAFLAGLIPALAVGSLVSDNQQDVAQWFTQNGDKKQVVMSLSEGLDSVIVSISRQPVSTGGYQPGMVKVLDRNMYYSQNYQKADLIRDHVGYFVTKAEMENPNYAKLAYENSEYKIWVVDLQ